MVGRGRRERRGGAKERSIVVFRPRSSASLSTSVGAGGECGEGGSEMWLFCPAPGHLIHLISREDTYIYRDRDKVRVRGINTHRGGGAHLMNSRSIKTIAPRISTMPGRCMSGFHRSGRHCAHQQEDMERKGREGEGERKVHHVPCDFFFFFFFSTLSLSSFWTSRGHMCHPFSSPVLAFNFLSRIGFSNPAARRLFIECLLTHALALSASQFVHKKKSQRIYTSMHSAGLELTKLTYTRLTRG